MKELVELLDINLEYDEFRIMEDSIIFFVRCKKSDSSCPKCKSKSSSIHSEHLRKFQDLPIQGKTVYIYLTVSRYFCKNKTCDRKTFSESFSFVSSHAQKTNRLLESIMTLSLNQSSLDTVKDLDFMGIVVKKSSICNYLKKS